MDNQEFQNAYEKTFVENTGIAVHHAMPPHHSDKDGLSYVDLDEAAEGLTRSQRLEIADALERWVSWCAGAEA